MSGLVAILLPIATLCFSMLVGICEGAISKLKVRLIGLKDLFICGLDRLPFPLAVFILSPMLIAGYTFILLYMLWNLPLIIKALLAPLPTYEN